jgi:hypothetical protein
MESFCRPTACPSCCPADYIDDHHNDQNRDHIDHSHRAVGHGDNHRVVADLQAAARVRLCGELPRRPVKLELPPGAEQTALQLFPASAGNENPQR